MTIQVNCPECDKEYQVTDDKAGKRFKCRECEAVVSVPSGRPSRRKEEDDFDDGFGDDFDDDDFGVGGSDPYSAPRKRRTKRGRSSRSIEGKGSVCAIILMVLGVISCLWTSFNVISNLIMGIDPQMLPPPGPERDGFIPGYYAGLIGVGVICLIYYICIIYGANNLRTHGSKTWAMTAAIMCCIPCCSPLFVVGIPFGIWALVEIQGISDAGGFRS